MDRISLIPPFAAFSSTYYVCEFARSSLYTELDMWMRTVVRAVLARGRKMYPRLR